MTLAWMTGKYQRMKHFPQRLDAELRRLTGGKPRSRAEALAQEQAGIAMLKAASARAAHG